MTLFAVKGGSITSLHQNRSSGAEHHNTAVNLADSFLLQVKTPKKGTSVSIVHSEVRITGVPLIDRLEGANESSWTEMI